MLEPIAITSFQDEGTRDLYNGLNTKAARGISRELWPRIVKKLDALNAAAGLNDLKSPGNQLEKLTGNFEGFWSVRVNQQYRICFRFESGNASDVFCEDIH